MPSLRSQELIVTGMSSTACASRIKDALRHLPSVRTQIDVNKGKVQVLFDGYRVTLNEVIKAIESAGFGIQSLPLASPHDLETPTREQPIRHDLFDLILAVLLSFALLLEKARMLMSCAIALPSMAQWALATPVLFWCGRHFYLDAWHAMRRGRLDINVLVILGALIAYAFSVVVVCLNLKSPLYFDTSAMIITLVLAGRMMERRVRCRAKASIETLLALRPLQAHVEDHGQVSDIAADQLQKGDIVVVRPGEQLPVDGVIIEGVSELNESVLSGESFYVCKHAGHKVFAATLNCTGVLRVRATHIGNDTSLARIIRLVDRAQGSKVYVQRLADKVAAFFIPIALAAALLIFFIGWGGSGNAVRALLCMTVLLVMACPCALGLASPTALMVGTGRGAAVGVLLRRAYALEQMRHVNTLVVDKTGTLTEGCLQVACLNRAPGISENELIGVAAGVEQYSSHPLAKALMRYAQQHHIAPLAVTGVHLRAGRGIIGKQQDEHVASGAVDFIRELTLPADPIFEALSLAWINRQEEQGITIIGVSRGHQLIGYIGLCDRLRTGARHTIKSLHAQGIHVVMLTGDTARVAARVAGEVGIDEVVAGVLPEGKVLAIEALKARDGKVAMLGDGLNDAPALATADVGIAIGTGAEVALDTADIVLMHNRLEGVVDALSLSRATLNCIHRNLFFAFFYNGLAIPLAALGILNPVIASVAMVLSVASVIINSLLLQRWRAPSLDYAHFSSCDIDVS